MQNSLNDYYKYADKAYLIMVGAFQVKNGQLYGGTSSGWTLDNQWIEWTAYHHWLNNDDIEILWNKLGITNLEDRN